MTDETLKRYALFGGLTYYPVGGWDDFVASFDTPEEAEKLVMATNRKDRQDGRVRTYEWHQVVDLTTGSLV